MATTKFATFLHTRTNKITRLLIYVVLEWTLIFLLLLNSLFSYLIHKFALYFGLKPPCLFCSRLDHHLDSQKTTQNNFSSYTKFICEQHATEISKIGYCSSHKKLFESKIVCDGCCSSSFSEQHDAPLFKWMKEIGIVEEIEDEKNDTIKKCCCCDKIISHRKDSSTSPYIDFMANLITERELDGCFPDHDIVTNQRDSLSFDQFDSGYQVLDDGEEDEVEDDDEEKEDEIEEEDDDVGLEEEKQPLLSINDDNNMIVTNQNVCSDMLPQHIEFYIDHDDYRLIPVEIAANSVSFGSNGKESKLGGVKLDEEDEMNQHLEEFDNQVDFVFEGDELRACCKVIAKQLSSIQEEEEEQDTLNEQVEAAVEVSQECEVEKSPLDSQELDDAVRTIENLSVLQEKEEEDEANPDQVEVAAEVMVETTAEVTTEVEKLPLDNQELVDVNRGIENLSILQLQEISLQGYKEDTESHCRRDEIGEENENLTQEALIENSAITGNGFCEVSHTSMQLLSTDENENVTEVEAEAQIKNEKIPEVYEIEEQKVSESYEIEEDKIPETPTCLESLDFQNKIQVLGTTGSLTEESIDGSIISENEIGDGATLIQKLKLELQSERKTLRELYAELEEERNASAIAANQTLAMINRLQEDKATMQMEALQYQRMMEEQSEYDQEALQMMNELMVKREKEKQELEKELEVYRKKLLDFEEREKIRILSRRMEGSLRSRNSSASCSYGEESDGLSIDLNHEVKDHEEESGGISLHCGEENGHHDTPSDEVLNLQDSLVGFEDERQSILEQLKVLEEKLFTLAEEEEEDIDEFNEENGGENGITHMNGKHQERLINGSMQKRLLPLFDEVEMLDGKEEGFDTVVDKSSITKFELEKKRLAIEEEVDHVYERLHALEADREFLKHCIGSLKKGDKGLDLLQEILQHLRDLKNVELHVMKNIDPCASV
ncbi:myosin-binding protein 2 [Silene latifolia]|uniref:myosin-binding protein 2 n=1 Tax=Silene latifolia TaxID=37657 RepID=UPI003D77F4A7